MKKWILPALLALLLPLFALAEGGKPLYAVQDENGLWGYIDCRGQIVIPGKFTWAEDFRGGYALACQFPEGYAAEDDLTGLTELPDGRWMDPECLYGVIDARGEWVVPPDYSEAISTDEGWAYAGGRDSGIIWFSMGSDANRREGFFDIPSGFFSGLVYDGVSFDFSGGMDPELIPVTVGGKEGFASRRTGEIVIPCRYARGYGYGFSGDRCAVALEEESGALRWLLIDRQGNEIPLPQGYYAADIGGAVSDGLFLVWERESGLCGFADTEGNLAIPARFKAANDFSDGRAVAQQPDGSWTVIDRRGQTVFPLEDEEGNNDFDHGLLLLRLEEGSEAVYVDRDGNEAFRLQVEGLAGVSPFKENGTAFYEVIGGGVGLFSDRGEVLTPPVFYVADEDWLREFSEGLLPISDYATLKMGYIDRQGQWAFPPVEGLCWEFRDGLAEIDLHPDAIFVDREGKEVFRYRFPAR